MVSLVRMLARDKSSKPSDLDSARRLHMPVAMDEERTMHRVGGGRRY
jgi:hypothetical protein